MSDAKREVELLQLAKAEAWRQGFDAGVVAARKTGIEDAADLAEQLSCYCGTNVQPAIAQIIKQIRKLATDAPPPADSEERR